MRKIGIIEVVLSGICFGFLGYFGKKAFEFHILPGELLALRYSIAAFIVLFYLILRNRKQIIINLNDTIISILLGVLGYAVFSSMFFYALTGLSASLTVLLLYTYPIIVTILSHYILKEEFTKLKSIALVLVSIGMYLLVSGEWKIDGAKYFISGLGAALFYSFYIIYSRKYLERVPAFTSSLYVQIGAGSVLSLIYFQDVNRPIFLLQNHFWFLFAMAFVCSFLAMSLFLAGLQKINSSETSILSTTEPISGVIIAYFLLGEKLSGMQLIGAVLILIGLITVGMNQTEQKGN